MPFEIRLLGPLELNLDGRPVPLPATRKAQSLLAYLVAGDGRPHSRERLAERFWPDRPRDKALHSLNTALWHLRRILPADAGLHADARGVQCEPGPGCWVDVHEFQSRVEAGEDPDLEHAVALYRGDFLEDFYDDWCLEERYRLEGLFLGALEQLAKRHEARGEWDAALYCAQQLLAHDPLRESVHCVAMSLHARRGDRAAVLQQYQRCRAALREQLGVAVDPQTTALCRALAGEVPEGDAAGIAAPAPAAGRSPFDAWRVPLAERAGELAELRAAWARACEGQGQTMLLEGEAGVGKSRLLDEFAGWVRLQRGQVAGGACYEAVRPQPYYPVTDLMQALLAQLPAAELRALPDWVLGEAARLAPEVTERRPAPETDSLLQPARLLEALRRCLRAAAGCAPLLIFIDDLHWASDSVLDFVRYCVPRMGAAPILFVGAYRGEEVDPEGALPALLRELARTGQAEVLRLRRLSPGAVQALLVALSGRREEIYPLAGRLYGETEGNPFFLTEMLKAYFEAGDIKLQARRWEGDWPALTQSPARRMPRGVEKLIASRVARLSPGAQAVLRLAAVAGQEFDFAVLSAAWEQGEEAALLAIEELLRRCFILEAHGPAGRDYAFNHSTVREVVYASMHHRRRRQVHRLIGTALERLQAGNAAPAGELARHFEGAGDTERALQWSVAAGEDARRRYALHEALDSFHHALGLLDPERADALAARALTGLAFTEREVRGDSPRVWAWLERALPIYAALSDRAGFARTCYALAYRHTQFDQARAWVERGLQAVQDVAGSEREVVMGYGLLARFYEHEGDFAQGQAWAQRQLAMSEQIGDRAGQAEGHHRLGSLCMRRGGPMGQAVAHEQAAARLAEELGWLDFAAGSHNIAGYCLLALGRTGEAEAECTLALRLSTELDIPWRQCWALHYLAQIAMSRGEWEQAARLLDRAEATMARDSAHFQEIVILRARGQLAAGRGDSATARLLFDTALALSRQSYPRYVPELAAEIAALDIAERPDAPETQAAVEQAYAQASASGMEDVLLVAGRLRGQLAARRGDLAGADAIFAETLRRCEELEQFVEAARTRAAWGLTPHPRTPSPLA